MQSVVGIVFSFDQSQVLLILRRDVPVWVLPGGGIDPGETAEEAVVRELLEETGLTVKIETLVGHYFPINRLAKKTAVFSLSVVAGTPMPSPETKQATFFSLDHLPQMPPPYLEWIKDALKRAPAIQRKLHSVNYKTLFHFFITHPILVARFLLARLGLPINR